LFGFVVHALAYQGTAGTSRGCERLPLGRSG
jgi:hypothetical protein